MAQILVPFDGSEHSGKALDKAISMSTEEDELIILYIIPAALMKELAFVDSDMTRAKAHEIVNRAIEKVKLREINVMGLVKEGDVSEEIINFASEIKASVIVIGSMGMSRIGKFSLGSVAERVTRHADRPVLIVR